VSLKERETGVIIASGGGKVENLILVFHFSRAAKLQLCECGNRAGLCVISKGRWEEWESWVCFSTLSTDPSFAQLLFR